MDKTIEFKKLEQAAYDGETQRIRALSDNEVDNTKLNMEGIKMILGAGKDIDDIDIKREANEVKKSTATAKTGTTGQ